MRMMRSFQLALARTLVRKSRPSMFGMFMSDKTKLTGVVSRTFSASTPSLASETASMRRSDCDKTRSKIFRIAAESSTTSTFRFNWNSSTRLPLWGATYYSGGLIAVTKGKFLIGAPEKTGWTDQQPAKEQTPHEKIETAKVSSRRTEVYFWPCQPSEFPGEVIHSIGLHCCCEQHFVSLRFIFLGHSTGQPDQPSRPGMEHLRRGSTQQERRSTLQSHRFSGSSSPQRQRGSLGGSRIVRPSNSSPGVCRQYAGQDGCTGSSS